LRVPPLHAVGSDIVFSFFTKIGGALMHWRKQNVDWRLALIMAIGSIPGALLGVSLLAHLRYRFGDGVNEILRTLIAVLLIVIPLMMVLQGWALRSEERSLRSFLPRWVNVYNGGIVTGFVGGLLVGLTSVGSGTVIMLLLILFVNRPPRTLVGTDIFHAVLLTGVTGLAHVGLGTVNFHLVAWLLMGSIPGVLLGSHFTGLLPAVWLRRVLLVLLIAAGLRMV
jgi:uncharacterized membrane protein YfcA